MLKIIFEVKIYKSIRTWTWLCVTSNMKISSHKPWQTPHLLFKPLQIQTYDKKVGGHGILCLPRLKKWGDTSSVPPPNCAHACNNYVLVGIRAIVCVQKPHQHFLQTLHPLRMLKIVFRDSSLYPNQLSLFCLLRLISASADRSGYISNFCSVILLHEHKNSLF